MIAVLGGTVAVAQSLAQACRQGQFVGRCMIVRRAREASRAGTAIVVARTVAIRAVGVPAAIAAARETLKAMVANPSQAALAWKRPNGRCASGPFFSSAITCSTIACRRWVASASTAERVLLVMNA